MSISDGAHGRVTVLIEGQKPSTIRCQNWCRAGNRKEAAASRHPAQWRQAEGGSCRGTAQYAGPGCCRILKFFLNKTLARKQNACTRWMIKGDAKLRFILLSFCGDEKLDVIVM